MEKLRVDVSHKSVEIIKRKKDRARLVYKFNNAENEYRNLINTATDVIFELDKHGNILFISKAWERLLGHEAHEVLDKRLSDFIHDEMRSKFEEKLFKIFTYEDKKYSGKLKIKNNEGHYRNIGIWMSLLSNDHPEHEDIIVGSISDAEEALRAKEALSLAEQKAQSIIENAAGGFYQMTLDGKFLSVNPSMAHILGYDSPEHLMRQKNDNLGYVFGTLKDKNRFMRELESSGHVSNFETKIYTKRGHEIWVNENARAVKNDIGEIEYIEGSMENVTQRKMVEMDLKEAMVASDLANRSKSEFLANMSHELRTPLNSIIGFAEIMKNEVLGAIENKQYKDYANDIYDSGNRLLKIINEILDVSRIESGERQLNETQIDMDDLIKNSLEFISARYESSKLTVINACEGRVPSIVGEERAIKQILLK
jgi:PAS domain S-box-containing protein